MPPQDLHSLQYKPVACLILGPRLSPTLALAGEPNSHLAILILVMGSLHDILTFLSDLALYHYNAEPVYAYNSIITYSLESYIPVSLYPYSPISL